MVYEECYPRVKGVGGFSRLQRDQRAYIRAGLVQEVVIIHRAGT